MILYLNKPYSFFSLNAQTNLYKALITGVFITLFLWLFDNNDRNGILLFVDNGAVVFVNQVLLFFIIPVLFAKKKIHNIKIWHYITWLTVAGLLGFSLMYAYVTPVYYETNYSFHGYKEYIIENLPFLFPVSLFVIALDYIFFLRTRLRAVKEITPAIGTSEPMVGINDKDLSAEFILSDETGNTIFSTFKNDIFFIRSADNYIEIYYLSEQKLVKELIRYRMSAVEADAANGFLTRVHRSYLCNLQKASTVSGGIQNCSIYFDNQEISIPVSRTKAKEIIQIVNTA
jgi:LytTr DNA-binding domain